MGRLRRLGGVRRSEVDARVELTPMIDVVFLLLTFFVFSVVMMVRADVLEVELPELGAGESMRAPDPIVIGVGIDGGVVVDGEAVGMEGVVEVVKGLRGEDEGRAVVLAVDVGSDAGVLIELADRLTGGGVGAFSILGEGKFDEGGMDGGG